VKQLSNQSSYFKILISHSSQCLRVSSIIKNLLSTAFNFSMHYSQMRIHKQTHDLIKKLMTLLQSANVSDCMTKFLKKL